MESYIEKTEVGSQKSEAFCGLWTKDDLDEFEKKISDLDVRLWGIQSWHR